MGVLDIGSNTGHLLVVDAYRGAPPMPAFSYKEPLRLAEHLDAGGAVDADGISRLLKFMVEARAVAEDKGCADIIAFATSAVRDASNADHVLEQVEKESGITLDVLPGADEARLTFLAVRRWFGWSSGRLGVFDIGGGSLEMASGADESPDAEMSLPLGAGLLTREWLSGDRVEDQVRLLRLHVRSTIANELAPLMRGGGFDHAVATSKTFRSLARLCGAPPSSDGPYVRRTLKRNDLQERLAALSAMTPEQVAELPGVSSDRSHQIVAGAIVADAVMDLFNLEALEVCPWALREGVLLERLDQMSARPA